MSNQLSNDRKKSGTYSENNPHIELNSNKISLHRVHQIEKVLGVRIKQAPNEILDPNISADINNNEQSVQLLKAFNLITNTKVRADILEMVLAAAQHENEPD